MVTDGCLSKDGRHIVMHSAEPQLLKAFHQCIKTRANITKQKGKHTSYKIQVGDIQLYNWLMSIGLSPAKTYSIGSIDISDKFFRDFLRGHLDGDGSIQAYTDKYNIYRGRVYTANRLFVRLISVSENHIMWLHSKIVDLVNIKGALIKRVDKTGYRVPMFEIKFAKKESIKLLEWIYYNKRLPCLLRKRRLAELNIHKIKIEKRKTYAKIT